MFFYNVVSELDVTQLLIVLFIMFCSIVIFSFLTKKVNYKNVVFSLGLGIILSIASLVFTHGYFGGTMYHEGFGWPAQYYSVDRNIEVGVEPITPIPFNQSIDLIKAIMSVTIYSAFVYLVFGLFESIKNRDHKIILMISFSLIIVLILSLGLSIINYENWNVGDQAELTIGG